LVTYVSTLVNSLRLNKNNALKQNLITGFNNKNVLKERLKNMFNFKKRKKDVLIGILVIAVITVSLISVNIFSKDDGSDKINTKGQLLQPKQVVENYIKYLNKNDKKVQKNLMTKEYYSIIWGRGSKDTNNIKYINYIKIESISEETNPFQKKSYLENGRGRRNGATEENVKIYKIEFIDVNWVFHRDKETKWCTVIRKDKNSPWLIDDWGE